MAALRTLALPRLASSYTGLLFTLRLCVEVFPLMVAIPGHNRIVVTAETTRRSGVPGNDVSGALASTSVSADAYLDDQHRVAIGITHDRGAFPKANFVNQRRTYISFRVKI